MEISTTHLWWRLLWTGLFQLWSRSIMSSKNNADLINIQLLLFWGEKTKLLAHLWRSLLWTGPSRSIISSQSAADIISLQTLICVRWKSIMITITQWRFIFHDFILMARVTGKLWIFDKMLIIRAMVLSARWWWSPNCVTQLKLYTVEKLSSTIFCCLWDVRHQCHSTKSPLFPIYTGIQALCQPCTT